MWARLRRLRANVFRHQGTLVESQTFIYDLLYLERTFQGSILFLENLRVFDLSLFQCSCLSGLILERNGLARWSRWMD
jgi:hypothetical protein